jgi:hypothetical protein
MAVAIREARMALKTVIKRSGLAAGSAILPALFALQLPEIRAIGTAVNLR